MIRIGIRAHDVGKMDAFTLAKKVKDFGFDGVQLVLKKALTDYSDLSMINAAFSDLDILMLGAYFNPVHPNKDIVFEGVNNFKEHLEKAITLKADFVGTETGSYMGSPWGYLPKNHSDEALEEVIDIFLNLTKKAEELHINIAIEGAYAHVAYSPERIKKILDSINSNNLYVTVDLFNYLYLGNYQRREEIFEECFKLFQDKIVIFHLKDFVIEDDVLKQVGLGKGLMDFPKMIKRIKQAAPNAYLIFEGVVNNDISESLVYIKNVLKGADI